MAIFPSDLASRGSRTAVAIGGESLSYRDLARAARAHASRLAEDGVRPGDRVAVWATPEPATLAALVGNALAGFATVPLDPALGERELSHVLADAAPKAVLASSPADFAARAPGVRAIATSGPAGKVPEVKDGAAPLLVLYTSGTTGPPKGAVLTHRNAAMNLDALAEAWGWTGDDVLVHALPLFHVHGLVLGVLGSLRAGGTLRLEPRFRAEVLCRAMGEGGTILFAVPTMIHRLADHLESSPGDGRQLARARLVVSGSAPLPPREHARLERLCGQRVAERYGLTETLINCAVRADGARTAGTVGPPLAGVELELADADDGLGEILVRGENVFAGYLNRPEATARAFDPRGFFRTEDLGALGADGSVRIAGRKATDLIKTGGYKVGAGEVEAALLEHPAVWEAAVVGAPDDDLGERIVAFVVVRDGAAPAPEELALHVAALLAPHKRPREVRLVEALPRNAMGKVLKRELAARPVR